MVPGQHLVLQVEKNASAAALSKHDPTRLIDWRTPRRSHRPVKLLAV
jgi:hypothetical protein